MRTIHDLADGERAVVTELRRHIAREFPELDVRMTVFGSRARGDADPESDMDILLDVPVAQLAFADKRRLRQAATDVSIAAGIIVSLLVVDQRIMAERGDFSIFENIRDEGIAV
jgi:predicted nucleotidyltransferase